MIIALPASFIAAIWQIETGSESRRAQHEAELASEKKGSPYANPPLITDVLNRFIQPGIVYRSRGDGPVHYALVRSVDDVDVTFKKPQQDGEFIMSIENFKKEYTA